MRNVFCSWISYIVLDWLHEGCEMDLLADFLHFGASVFLLHVGLEQCEVWGVKSAVWSVQCEGSSGEVRSVKCGVWSLSLECEERSVKCEVWGLECEGSSEKCEVWSVKCGVWSVECEVSVWSAKSAVWSVKCEVWSVKEAVRSEKCEVWSVKCGVWSLKFGVRRVQCEVWSVKTLLRLSLKKSNGCRGKDTVRTGCLWTIGHLCLGNFRRRLARVYVKCLVFSLQEFYFTRGGLMAKHIRLTMYSWAYLHGCVHQHQCSTYSGNHWRLYKNAWHHVWNCRLSR